MSGAKARYALVTTSPRGSRPGLSKVPTKTRSRPGEFATSNVGLLFELTCSCSLGVFAAVHETAGQSKAALERRIFACYGQQPQQLSIPMKHQYVCCEACSRHQRKEGSRTGLRQDLART
eukprot:gnl/TRDRNA2_/TRDRNA2_173417_c0_seq4.p3 gnl/TRDRNA2_/TRDRNA2_173417_c0~~gnl/TRDRNA2_/TRDRNA2_173417_c0_seq4.p3  ORF type:complete len:120 (-),score=8.41 gnl/TRDRNA2_/TRDRNA2_173417_c0_seq4:198-557(-)